MDFEPLVRMWSRIEHARQDSDAAFFMELMYLGEMLTKTVVAGMIAAINDDSNRHRYRLLHRLVRADGLGEWQDALTELLTGTPLQHLAPAALDAQKDLTQRFSSGHWQNTAVSFIHTCLEQVEPACEPLPAKVDLRRWFTDFVQLRNKTRGHGAPSSGMCASLAPPLEKSLHLLSDHLLVLQQPWAYLHRNLSGKYRVMKLCANAPEFDPLKADRQTALQDGIYVHFGQPRRVDLLESNPDILDFYYANGGFIGRKYELLSYITGNKAQADGTQYLAPATELPQSATQGVQKLEVQGKCFTNLPQQPAEYIARSELEAELHRTLLNDRHPVVTLVGRGGIGKTSLALTVLHKVAQEDRFIGIVWFSARDIDLLPEGPKIVRPHVLTNADIARDLVTLFQPRERDDKGFKAITYLAETLTKSAVGPLLFVFDNFETVQNPPELFTWLDTYIRLPNKLLITARHREFKGDYGVEVGGMTETQCDELVDATAGTLGIRHLITTAYKRELYHESDGHPYVVKILVGESASAKRLLKIERIVAAKHEILDALFERTYARLTPAARRVFLTVCGWRSVVPTFAVEAVLLRPTNEKMEVAEAIEELHRSSFIDLLQSEEDRQLFISVPLVASEFGRRKLSVSADKPQVEQDTAFLQLFGPMQASDVRRGVGPSVRRLIKTLAERISRGRATLDNYVEVLEFVCRQYPPGWLLLAELYEEIGGNDSLSRTKGAIERYLEATPHDATQLDGWERLAAVCRKTHDTRCVVHALLQLCELPNVGLHAISNAANTLNGIFGSPECSLDWQEKTTTANRVIKAMRAYIADVDATDCSRLAWLYVRIGDHESARQLTKLGLSLDPSNEYCLRLAQRLF